MSEEQGFVSCLLDFSFAEFVTTRVIKLLYVLSIVGAGCFSLAMVVSGFAAKSGAIGILTLLISPVVFVLMVLFSRIYLELIIVVFKIAENTSRMVQATKEEE